MKNILALTKRNCLLFIRSKQVVFSSLLSSIILIALYFLFIGHLYSQGFNEIMGSNLSSEQINAMIYIQMIMGVLVINSVSLSTGMFTFMARDLETQKTNAFMLTKAKAVEITLSYLISALIVSFLLNFLTLIVSVIIIGASTSIWLGAGAFFAIVGVMIITSIIGCAIMLLITSLVRSSIAIGVISGFLGTILGFLCGIYMPHSNMGKGAVYVGSFLPFTHLTIWLKQIALGNIFNQIGIPNEIRNSILQDGFSASNIGLCGANIPLWGMILMSVAFALLCFAVSIVILIRMFKKQNNTKIKKEKTCSKKY